LTTELTPLFIFSLPRSGSTLLQRILGAHKDIATVTETHILLPLLYALKTKGIYAEYRHEMIVMALEDFCGELPNGVDDYYSEVGNFATNLYKRVAKSGAKYFLDKTPAYNLVIDEIIRLFPHAKFIFLWRNPLSVVASCIESWGRGRWNLYNSKLDLFEGMANFIGAYQRHQDRVCAVRYEDLLTSPEHELKRLFQYLQLEPDPTVLTRFSAVNLAGRITDLTGTKRYKSISLEPLQKWRPTLSNSVRKLWCRRYLKWIGTERLATMGYDLDSLILELDSLPFSLRMAGSDLSRMLYGLIYCAGDFRILKFKIQALPNWHRVVIHT
jgi:hypothetical protein